MLNAVPQVTGIFVANHLKISYLASVELASLASGTVSVCGERSPPSPSRPVGSQ